MEIRAVSIKPEIQQKIYRKHGILTQEIEAILAEGKPIFKKASGNQVMAIGLFNRYVTIFFEYDSKTKEADITTAYQSDRKQVKYYKKTRKIK